MSLGGYGFRSRCWNAALAARDEGVTEQLFSPTDGEKEEKKGDYWSGMVMSW